MKKFSTILLIIFFFGCASNISIAVAAAAVVRFDVANKEVSRQEQFAVDLLVDMKGDIVNALQAEINYPKDIIHLVGIREGNSIVSLWLDKPTEKDGKITFSGIIPGGFNGLIDPLSYPKINPGNIFKLIFQGDIKGIGEIKISNVHILRSDGKGTEIAATTEPLLISVNSYTLDQKYEIKDTVPPEFQVLVFEPKGKGFGNFPALIFQASDKETGIKEYQLKIDDDEWAVVESPYTTKNYFLSKKFSIKAIDYSGNERIAVISSPVIFGKKEQGVSILLLILLIFGLGFLIKKIFKV